MVHCFIYAPIRNGTNGELLWHGEKATGHFLEPQLEQFCEQVFPGLDFREMVIFRNSAVTENHVTQYYLRRERGMLQRYSASGTFEDLHWDEWKKMMKSHCPEVMRFSIFLVEDFFSLPSIVDPHPTPRIVSKRDPRDAS